MCRLLSPLTCFMKKQGCVFFFFFYHTEWFAAVKSWTGYFLECMIQKHIKKKTHGLSCFQNGTNTASSLRGITLIVNIPINSLSFPRYKSGTSAIVAFRHPPSTSDYSCLCTSTDGLVFTCFTWPQPCYCMYSDCLDISFPLWLNVTLCLSSTKIWDECNSIVS